MPDPHLHMQDLPSFPKPITGSSAESLAAIATQHVMKDIAEGRITFLVAFTFRDRSWRMWRLHNVSETDDVIRAIAQHEKAEGVVVVHPAPVPPGMKADKLMNIAAENRQGKFDHAVATRGAGEKAMHQVLGKRYPPGTPCRWFGVEPDGEIEVWFEGYVGGMGSGKGEA